ncbi:DUF1295 domain-containing protein [Martelella alba]|uniref:DUF1295 domain-containing protein n=1 Tax=Martelella alba TaxID=2590451 RepID=A0A506UIY3_9HYPH|nr:DUF1295 domain-containing protein [Martelella alba]TPW33266.1 DUF1295 domain-containing protein [Martelella alba]
MSVTILIGAFVWLVLAMSFAWLVQRKTGNSGWIDAIWSAATGLGGLFVVACGTGFSSGRSMLAFALVFIWALRLSVHIAARSAHVSDDPRYRALLQGWGTAAAVRLWWFLQIQAVASFILLLSIYAAASNTARFPGFWDGLAIIVALVAISGEGVADFQLQMFRKGEKEPGEKRVCEVGLWRYCRHPNYFFEWLWWCSWPLIAVSGHGFSGMSLIALLAPVMMYWLLNSVSGIPHLEAHMLRSRGDAYRRYQKRVNAFFPGPRRPVG